MPKMKPMPESKRQRHRLVCLVNDEELAAIVAGAGRDGAASLSQYLRRCALRGAANAPAKELQS